MLYTSKQFDQLNWNLKLRSMEWLCPDPLTNLCYSIQILTALRGRVKIIGPRWCQNHDYARSEAEGIVMVLTSLRAYNLNCAPNKKQSKFVLYTKWKEQNYLAKTLTCTLMWFYRMREHNKRSTPIDCAPGHSHFFRHSQNHACSFNQSDDRNLQMRYIIMLSLPIHGGNNWPGTPSSSCCWYPASFWKALAVSSCAP